jgi:hypothetical protein
LLSQVPVDGKYLPNLLAGMVTMAVGLGLVFVSNATAANAGVPAGQAGLAAALLNASQQIGGALGLAVFTAVATARTNHLLAQHTAPPSALTAGFQRGLFASGVALALAAVIALGTRNVRSDTEDLAAGAAR